jgi:ubiquinone/menaquinone biosynthesis C-methylase UbiE
MRALDRAGIGQIRSRTAGGAVGDVLEIGIGTGLNLGAYPDNLSLHGIDLSDPALSIAAVRADRLGRQVVLTLGDAAILPYPDRSFDTIVATFVQCSVANVDATLREAAPVLRAGGTIRLLEHARERNQLIAGLQRRSAPAWARASGGCRLDHDVSRAVQQAGLQVVDERHRAGGILVEIVAAVANGSNLRP